MRAAIEFLKIVLLSIAAAVCYGIAHDLITTRVCLEYFTVFHEPVFRTQSPTLLALGWGTIATWWFGFFLGLPAAVAARAGRLQALGAKDLLRPIGVLLATMAAASLTMGIAGYFAAKAGRVQLEDPWAALIPLDKHPAFFADWWAHRTAYAVGAVGGFVLCGWILYRRFRLGVSKDLRASASRLGRPH